VTALSRFSLLRLQRPRIAPTLAVVFAGTVTLATLVTGAFVLRSSLHLANQNTILRLQDATRLLASRLDADDLAALRSPEQVRSPSYLQAHRALVSALREIKGVRFIYTLRKAEEPVKDPFSRYLFVVDGTPFDDEEFAPIGEVMTTTPSTDALHRVWISGRFEADRRFVNDRWGTWLSGYLPLRRTDGSFETILGIDISASEVQQERNRILRNLAQAYLLSLLLTLPLSALIGSQISDPLRHLNRRLQALAQLDFDADQQRRPSGQWIDELHRITLSMQTLQKALSDFTSYVPTALVRKLVLNSDALNLAGEERELAIMFTDIREFTALTEHLHPGETLALLNEYFALIHKAAESSHGVLDKYIGDGALLFWGAPDSIDQPARACLEAALLCQQQLDQLNAAWRHQGRDTQFFTSFGLDYGRVVVGNIGPRERVNYSIVGDRVNQAQRIERITRRYDSHILASADFITALGAAAADYLILRLDHAQLRGISQTVEVFEVLARRSEATESDVLYVENYTQARRLLAVGQAQAALLHLRAIPQPHGERAHVLSLIAQLSAAAAAG
jgi:class 3 adenylate cyclase